MKSFCRRCLSVLLVSVMMVLLLGCEMAEDENKVTDIKAPTGEAATDLDHDAVMMKIEKIKGVLEKYYMGDIDYEKATDGIYAGLIDSLGDEACRELSLKELLILKRIVELCKWH